MFLVAGLFTAVVPAFFLTSSGRSKAEWEFIDKIKASRFLQHFLPAPRVEDAFHNFSWDSVVTLGIISPAQLWNNSVLACARAAAGGGGRGGR